MRFTLKLVVLFSLIIYLTTGIALYNQDLLRVMYWPFYQDNFVLGFILIGLACFIVLSSFLDEELLQRWFGFDKLQVCDYHSVIDILSNMTSYDTIRVCYTKKDLKAIAEYHEDDKSYVDNLLGEIEIYKNRNQLLANEVTILRGKKK